MNYNVFIVDSITFKYHLEYKFAGTGATGTQSPFLNDCYCYLHPSTERNLVGMIADVSKIRIGDKVIFYLQANGTNEGRFYGVFKAKSQAFFDENDANNYLHDEMCKGLSFRILIENDKVYPKGITEHEYLDNLDYLHYPYEMCWSLIYRKLKGNRGCTMITQLEFYTLLIKLKTNNTMYFNSENLSFDENTYEIIESDDVKAYEKEALPLDILPRLLVKSNDNKAFEVHLQAFLLQNFDNELIKPYLCANADLPCWIGNEVSCGVGMQRIDIMTIQKNKKDVYIKITELKCVTPYKEILTKQMPWYIKWVSQYIAPYYLNSYNIVHLIPCVIAKENPSSDTFIKLAERKKYFSAIENLVVEPVEFISFNTSPTLEFKKEI